MTDEEMIALAKQFGAEDADSGVAPMPGDMLISTHELRAYTSAIRQKDMERLAMMREALEIANTYIPSGWNRKCEPLDSIGRALSETADVQKWTDEERAKVLDRLLSAACNTDYHELMRKLAAMSAQLRAGTEKKGG